MNSACLQLWHPLKALARGAPSGAVGSLGTIKRPDGIRQVTFKGLPLYTFAQGQKAGEARGQGFKDVGTWSAATTSGRAAQSRPAVSGGSYGY